MQVVCTEYQVNLGVFIDQITDDPFFLGHTAAYSEDLFRMFCFQRLEIADLPKHMVFRSFADRACIEDQQVSIFLALGGMEMHLLQQSADRLSVTYICLAAVCTDIVGASFTEI